MPLKFLKKCRQYNVTSKSFFVIPVHHLLDTSTTVDCTISSESKGQECLDNVCQRLLIQQPEFFGLRYIVKGKEDELRWVDLERSLSRQLEKYAAGTKLYLRVRHYVTTGVRHLSDEVTRYYYFLQLKSDIYEGKITCDIRTAILLALYCRQAEYDSYQNEKQTKEFLKKSLVLPKNLQGLTNDGDILDSLIVEVLQQNAGIQHLTQSQAEEMYIQCCQQLDGYGEERFQAKDTLGNDLLLGLSINGMIVHAENGRQYFPWKDFHTVTIDKKTIKIEQNKADGSIVGSFNFSEADVARYFWKLCITHHKFFKRYIDEDSPSIGDGESGNNISIAPNSTVGANVEAINAASAFGYDFSDSREDLLLEQQQRAIYTSSLSGGPSGIISTTGGLQQPSEYLVAHNFQQQQQQMTSHGLANSNALMSSNISLAASHQSGNGNNGSNLITAPHVNSTSSWLNKEFLNEYGASSQQLSNSLLDTRLQQSSSCLDLSNNNLHHSSSMLSHSNSHNNNNNHILSVDAHERERLKAMLPTYRPAPDYETAVQLKYRSPSSELHNPLTYQTSAGNVASNVALHGSKFAATYYAGSQPDVHQAAAGVYGESLLLNQLAQHRYPDVAQPAAALHHHYNAALAASNNQVIGGNAAAGNNAAIYIDMAQHLQLLRSKPPPPYPVNRLSSSSTPDLAVASHRPLLGYRNYVTGSSPDLVSNRNFLNSHQYHPYASSGVGQNGNIANSNALAMSGGNQTTAVTTSGTMFHQYPYMSHMGHSQQYLPHGTFENLNMIEEQPSIVSQLRQSAMSQAASSQAATNQSYEQKQSSVHLPTVYQTTKNIQETQSTNNNQNPPAALQRSVMNGSVEPIYENVPLPKYTTESPNVTPIAKTQQPTPPQRNTELRSSGASTHAVDTIRNRTSSIQSAPGGTNTHQPPVPAARHHQHHHHTNPKYQQQQQKKQDIKISNEIERNSSNFNNYTNRAASIETQQFLEPMPPQRAMRAASAAPAISSIQPPQIQTPPPRQKHHNKANLLKNTTPSSSSSVDVTVQSSSSPVSSSSTCVMTTSRSHHFLSSHDDSLQQQFGAMNLSTSSSLYNTTFDTTAMSSNTTITSSNTTNSSSKETKRKKRWNILGRSKTPDKQKSATLGREKASPSAASKWLKTKSVQDDLNLPHQRWSTGAAANRLQPISGQYSKDKLCQILNEKINDPQLFMEFESISKRRELASYYCALMEENASKNSDPNFLPYDDNRVRLTPSMENRHGYVNASHISATVGTKQRFYIVAQSPHNDLTTRIFWQCVWEADVYLVVQLSDDLNYIPPTTHQRLEFGQFQVYQEFSQTTDRCITSKLRLYHMQSRRYRSVWHLNYTDWVEQNCPRDVNHYLDFLEELNSVRMASINEVPPGHNTNPPVLLHCHEGGGRSGVTLTADLLLYTLDHNEDLDIPRVIGQLRHQRDSIIPSLAQYKFIYSLLFTYLKRNRLI